MKPLLSVAELTASLNDADLCLIDCRHQLAEPAWGRAAYAAGHLPGGAAYLSLDDDLSGACTGRNGRHPWPAAEALAACLGELGLSRDCRIVVYDDVVGVPVAARLWWLLRWLGHERVQVLDGGYSAWVAAGGALSQEVPQRAPAHFAVDLQPGLLVDAEAVLANLPRQDFRVVDARSAERFRGLGETLDPVGGHIPQALNRCYLFNLEDGCFKSPATLRAEWGALLGEWPVDKLIHQCGSGVTACHNLLALESAGLSGGRLYAGSWSEWCADPARPVVRD